MYLCGVVKKTDVLCFFKGGVLAIEIVWREILGSNVEYRNPKFDYRDYQAFRYCRGIKSVVRALQIPGLWDWAKDLWIAKRLDLVVDVSLTLDNPSPGKALTRARASAS